MNKLILILTLALSINTYGSDWSNSFIDDLSIEVSDDIQPKKRIHKQKINSKNRVRGVIFAGNQHGYGIIQVKTVCTSSDTNYCESFRILKVLSSSKDDYEYIQEIIGEDMGPLNVDQLVYGFIDLVNTIETSEEFFISQESYWKYSSMGQMSLHMSNGHLVSYALTAFGYIGDVLTSPKTYLDNINAVEKNQIQVDSIVNRIGNSNFKDKYYYHVGPFMQVNKIADVLNSIYSDFN